MAHMTADMTHRVRINLVFGMDSVPLFIFMLSYCIPFFYKNILDISFVFFLDAGNTNRRMWVFLFLSFFLFSVIIQGMTDGFADIILAGA